MHVERFLRLIAGVFVIASLVLASIHSEYWLFFVRPAGRIHLEV